jgi:membrane fusion protein, multidrug efflux system
MNIHLQTGAGASGSRPAMAKSSMSVRNLARLGACCSILALLGACHKAAAPPPQGPPQVGYVTVQSQAVTRTVELPGRTNPTLTSDVRPQVNGILKARLFTEGGDVKAGQVLYQIDPAPYQAALDQAKGQLANAEAALTTARLQAQRYADLVKINAVSRQDNDNAQASFKQAAATVQADQAQVESAQINLGYTKVRAPISGRIGRSLVTPGALVTADQPTALATIQSMDPIYVDATQSADQLLSLRKALSDGQLDRAGPNSAKVTLMLADNTRYPSEGELRFSEVTVDPTTDSVTLRAVFPNAGRVLLPGMFVREELNEGTYPHAILAPQQGVSHDPKGAATALVVGADGKAEPRMLKVAGMQGDRWIVLDGLHPGDRLIVQGLLTLQPGMPVKPIPAQLPTAPAADVPTAQGAGG